MKKYLRGVLLSLGVLLLLPGIQTKAADGRTIANGVFIGDIDVSGMSVTDAGSAVNAYFDRLAEADITLTAGEGKSITIKGDELGISWRNPQVVEEAYNLGHCGNVVQRYKALRDLEQSNHRYDIEYGFNDEHIVDIVSNRCSSFNQKKVNFSLKKTADGFEVTQGQTGYLIDVEGSVDKIKEFVKSGWNGEATQIQLCVAEDVPLGSAEELSRVRDVLGTFTTSYKSSGASRSANVANGCSLINGTTLYPGEEFSVLDVITPFTEANGYFPAGSYLNGVVVESIGGGICQVSTTLYNAVLLAELDVTERHNHSMIVTYVDPSADAAIAESGGKNFRFVNSTDYPIYIEGRTTADKQITFTIYGVETRPAGRVVSFKSEVLEKIPASEDRYSTDASQAIGYVGVQSAHIGYKAQLKKVVSENGAVVSEEVINSSNYKMVPRLVTVGTGGADPNMVAQLQTAIATKDLGTVKAVAGALAAARDAAGTENAEAAAIAAAQAVNAANQQIQQAAAESAPVEDAEAIITN
ncbi:VanW family protein [Butyrivibrio sp. YAB3001]|uniref:VanW family protein n=1 Tax=Butyrivibrio sp. YAB3001 TaxID=1520812 RepID=UPI0008F646FD|nr:VanW family protein [Butyrivibrio sp. YAB3001]SFC10669.1 Vancomycin resistance protein YoaR, contains peptidoglycan-binding and VanW domains [Butyrivibrio sp. YAB3001]